MKKTEIPDEFFERLKRIVPDPVYEPICRSFGRTPVLSLRVNLLKNSPVEAEELLSVEGARIERCLDVPEGLLIPNWDQAKLRDHVLIREGKLYAQSMASMLAVAILDPQMDERVLDLCAAPGSKASQIAARMNNTGVVTAVEVIRDRYYKLRSVCELLGCRNMEFKCLDGRRFEARDGLYDRVLVDAPCSSEGRFRSDQPKTFAYWSTRKIKEMVKKQRGLLLNAGQQLKAGGVLVYSTCTFAPEENEGVVDWFLRKTDGCFELMKIQVAGIETYPALLSWEKKEFNPQVERCLRVLPGEAMPGFFIAKFLKVSE